MRSIDLNKELEFENSKVLDSYVRKDQSKYYGAVSLSEAKHKELTRQYIKDKVVLEIGCSAGYDAIEYAKNCKMLYACDLSDVAIKHAKALEIFNAEFVCCDAHSLPYESNSFDNVIVNSLLHHLDLVIILDEIKRVLKPGGYLILKEPLGTNPLINLYRYLTPKSRTPDERPFDFNDLKLLSKNFEMTNVNFYGGFELFSAFIIFKPFKYVLYKLDSILSITPLRYFYWSINGALRVK